MPFQGMPFGPFQQEYVKNQEESDAFPEILKGVEILEIMWRKDPKRLDRQPRPLVLGGKSQ